MSSGFDWNHYRRSGPAPTYHGASVPRSGMVQAPSVPKPVQTSSLKAENGGQDINFPLVHRSHVGWGASASSEAVEKAAPEPAAEPASIPTAEKRNEPWAKNPRPSEAPQVPPEPQHGSPPQNTRWGNVHIDYDDRNNYDRFHDDERSNSYRHDAGEGGSSALHGNYHTYHSDRPYERNRYDRNYCGDERRWNDDYGYRQRQHDERDFHPRESPHYQYSYYHRTDRRRDDQWSQSRFRNDDELGGNEHGLQSHYGHLPSWHDRPSRQHQPPPNSEEDIVLQTIRERDAAEARARLQNANEASCSHGGNGGEQLQKEKSRYQASPELRFRQTSGEPSGASEEVARSSVTIRRKVHVHGISHETGARLAVNQEHGAGQPQDSPERTTKQEIKTKVQDGERVEREALELDVPDGEERERRRRRLALEQQQKVLRQVAASRASRMPAKKESRKSDSGAKTARNLLPRPNCEDTVKAERWEYTRTRCPRTKGLLFLRLPDGSLSRVDSRSDDRAYAEAGHEGISVNTEESKVQHNFRVEQTTQNQTETNDTTDHIQASPPAVSAWKSGPPPGILMKEASSSCPDNKKPAHLENYVKGRAAERDENHINISTYATSGGERNWLPQEQGKGSSTKYTTVAPIVGSWDTFADRALSSVGAVGFPKGSGVALNWNQKQHEEGADLPDVSSTVPHDLFSSANNREDGTEALHADKKEHNSMSPKNEGNNNGDKSQRKNLNPKKQPGKAKLKKHREHQKTNKSPPPNNTARRQKFMPDKAESRRNSSVVDTGGVEPLSNRSRNQVRNARKNPKGKGQRTQNAPQKSTCRPQQNGKEGKAKGGKKPTRSKH